MKLELVKEHDGYNISDLKIYQTENGQFKKRFTCNECGIQVGECFCWDELELAVMDIEETSFLCPRHFVEQFYNEDSYSYAHFIDEICGTNLNEKIHQIFKYECQTCISEDDELVIDKLNNECDDIIRNLTEDDVKNIYDLITENWDCEFSGACCER